MYDYDKLANILVRLCCLFVVCVLLFVRCVVFAVMVGARCRGLFAVDFLRPVQFNTFLHLFSVRRS